MLSKGKPSSNFENIATAATACPCHSDTLIKSRNKFLGMLYGNILNNLSKMWHFRIGFTALLFSLQMFNHKIFNSLCIQPKGERECFFWSREQEWLCLMPIPKIWDRKIPFCFPLLSFSTFAKWYWNLQKCFIPRNGTGNLKLYSQISGR